MLKGKHIVLGVTGGIAAYKSAMLLRLLVKRGAEVQVVMTPAGKQMITPATMAALSGKPVVSEFFSANNGEWHSHVDLGVWADLMIVAPATACTIGKMVSGVADNMLVTTYLSAKEHVMVAPAMDLDMWAHPSTQRNVAALRRDGVEIIEPGSGELASHLVGKGRMAEPEEIVERIEAFFRRSHSLEGKRVLVTAGPTYEDIDPVRFIGNYSSGKMGFAIAAECAARGAEVTLVAGPVSLPTPCGVMRVDVCGAEEMLEECVAAFPGCDLAVMAAAVADYRPEHRAERKIKREKEDEMVLHLVKNPDIAATLGEMKAGRQALVGFALETDNEQSNALDKMRRKQLDMIVLNSLRDPEAGFMKDTNRVTILFADGEKREYAAKLKSEVAKDVVDAAESVMHIMDGKNGEK